MVAARLMQLQSILTSCLLLPSPTAVANIVPMVQLLRRLTDNQDGAFSSSAGLALDATSGTIDLVVSNPGNYTVAYRSSNGTCNSSTSTTVTVAQPGTHNSYQPRSGVCACHNRSYKLSYNCGRCTRFELYLF